MMMCRFLVLSIYFIFIAAYIHAESPPASPEIPDDAGTPGCGITISPKSKRIVGGESSKPHAHPWDVQVLLEHNLSQSMCAGTLIDKQWVLTTAQCVLDGVEIMNSTYTLKKVYVKFGKQKLGEKEKDEAGMDVPLENVYRNSEFNLETMAKNIALIKLPKPVETTKTTRAICLLPSNFARPDGSSMEVVISAWGLMDNVKVPDVLQQAKFKLADMGQCARAFSKRNTKMTDDMLCMVKKTGAMCAGDAGGPVEAESKSGKKFLLGIGSFGEVSPEGKCESGAPQVATFVPALMDWINEKTGLNFP